MKPLAMKPNDTRLIVWTLEALMERFPQYKFALVLNSQDGSSGGVIASSKHTSEMVLETVRLAKEARDKPEAEESHVAFLQRNGQITVDSDGTQPIA